MNPLTDYLLNRSQLINFQTNIFQCKSMATGKLKTKVSTGCHKKIVREVHNRFYWMEVITLVLGSSLSLTTPIPHGAIHKRRSYSRTDLCRCSGCPDYDRRTLRMPSGRQGIPDIWSDWWRGTTYHKRAWKNTENTKMNWWWICLVPLPQYPFDSCCSGSDEFRLKLHSVDRNVCCGWRKLRMSSTQPKIPDRWVSWSCVTKPHTQP